MILEVSSWMAIIRSLSSSSPFIERRKRKRRGGTASEVFRKEMAMAMATTLAAAGARILSPVSRSSSTNASCASTSSSSSSLAHLCSSFKGLSVQTGQKGGSRHGGDISSLSGISSAPNVSPTTTTRKLVFTVAKMKTHKASAKRFKVTGSGKIMRRQAYKQHLLRKKNSNRKRRLSKVVQVNRCDYDNVIGALPYLKVKGRLT